MSEDMRENVYAQAGWTVEDILTLRPSWSVQRCERELQACEGHLQERMIEVGWEVLHAILPEEEGSVYVLALDDGEDGCEVPMYREADGNWTGQEPEDVLSSSQLFASEGEVRAAFRSEEHWNPCDHVWFEEYDLKSKERVRAVDLKMPDETGIREKAGD